MKTRSGFLSIVFLCFIVIYPSNAWAKKPICPDGICNGGETAETCPVDCSAALCGDGICNGDETYETCPDDCDPPASSICDNNGICDDGEDCLSCPNDCNGVTTGKPSGRFCCGLDTWDEEMCGASAGPYCGDGHLDPGEECDDGSDSSYCDFDCTIRFCGDGYTNTTAGEQCDDGNTDNGDGCDNQCHVE
ncbi:MAG: hypothetical protein P8Z37_19550, partial [Acidobacteriota bacterium]